MNRSLHHLLSTLSYDPRRDTLFFAGDLLAKSTEAGSLAILDFLSQRQQGVCFPEIEPHRPGKSSLPVSDSAHGYGPESERECKPVYAVRGNHDQMIVQWRAWREWFEPLQLTFPSAEPHPHPHPRRFSVPSVPPQRTSTQSATYDAGPPVGSGSQFLALVESEWLRDRTADPSGAGSDPQEWADTARKRAVGTWRAEWWKRIPQPGKGHTSKDWLMFGDHYWIARDMKREHAQFLFSLPLVIHIPSEHFYLVHGGLLPLDPKRSADDERQPLAHLPSSDDITSGPLDEDDDDDDDDEEHAQRSPAPSPQSQDVLRTQSGPFGNITEDDVEELRAAQERAVLQDVPPNRDPWVVLNMRGVRKGGKVTRRGDKGRPWAKIWNGQMKRCGGFKHARAGLDDDAEEYAYGDDAHWSVSRGRGKDDDGNGNEDNDGESPLPCYPSTVVYGHAASRDLDVKRWTVGLDTGCLYGRRLTSLVLTRKHSHSHAALPTRTSPAEDGFADEAADEDESSDEEEDELDDDDGDDARGTRERKTWRRHIKFGDKGSRLDARLVSIKCPKAGDFAGP
ncbi:hypothetical protein BD413DRAFT_603240 [Trametes elegans]|nr:hypothetical protein BD413DRAFT_603240 [Trametes elegans]